MAAISRKAADGEAVAARGRPRCELERWIDTYGEGATGAAYGRMNLRNVYANGQQVAGLDEAGKIDVLSRLTGFSNTDAGKTQVVAQAGDTLRSLAQRVYGNGNLWYLLAEANGLGEDPNGELVAGTSLTVPEAKTSSNDANTFKPYDPGEITGPTSPGLPYIEPPDKGCGTLGMIIMVIVAVVVTIYTAGALSGLVGAGMGTLTAGSAVAVGAIAGAAGAAASMAVGSAMGVASFSWRGVAAGAITGAITGGLASQFGSVGSAVNGTAATSTTAAVAPNFGKAIALSLANAGAGYAGQKLAGMDVSFSWRSIASSAVSSMVSAKVTPGIVDKFGLKKTDFGYDFASGLTSGMVSAGVRSSFGQTLHRSDYTTVVADAFGNALGNASARGIEAKSAAARQVESLDTEQRAHYDKARRNGVSHAEALNELKRMGIGVDSAQTFALGAQPGDPLIVETVEAPAPFDPYQEWRDDFNALCTGRVLFSPQGRDLSQTHSELIDWGISLVDAFESLSYGADNLDAMASILTAVQNRDTNSALLKPARLDPLELSGLDIDAVRARVAGGLAGSIESTYRLAQDTRRVVIDPNSYLSMSDLFGFLDTLAEGGTKLGHTTLTADIASMMPLAGAAVSGAQVYALELDKRDLGTMASIGMISPSAYQRALLDIGYEQNVTTVGAAIGGAPGKVGRIIQGAFVFGTPSDAEAGANLSKFERSVAAAQRRAATLTRHLTGELRSAYDLKWSQRGDLVEDLYLKHINPGDRFGNFKTLDDFNFTTGHAISVKSIDLGAARSLDPKTLEKLLKSYIDKVSSFTDHTQNVRVNGNVRIIDIGKRDVFSRELVLGYQQGQMSEAQRQVIESVQKYAAKPPKPVTFTLFPIR